MRVCGIELKGNDAVLALLSLDMGLFDIPDFRARKLDIRDAADQQQLKDFQFAMCKLIEDYKIDKLVIRQRPMKGKFAGGGVGFKLEAVLQMIPNIEVVVMTTTEIKEQLKENPVPIEFRETGLKVFQETAFNTAFAYMMPRPAPTV
jgi:hypothetical protein